MFILSILKKYKKVNYNADINKKSLLFSFKRVKLNKSGRLFMKNTYLL